MLNVELDASKKKRAAANKMKLRSRNGDFYSDGEKWTCLCLTDVYMHTRKRERENHLVNCSERYLGLVVDGYFHDN